MTSELTRIIPERRETWRFYWIRQHWLKYSMEYKGARERLAGRGKAPTMVSCAWCGVPFKFGEWMALAARKPKRNVVLCVGCTKEALEEEATPTTKYCPKNCKDGVYQDGPDSEPQDCGPCDAVARYNEAQRQGCCSCHLAKKSRRLSPPCQYCADGYSLSLDEYLDTLYSGVWAP